MSLIVSTLLKFMIRLVPTVLISLRSQIDICSVLLELTVEHVFMSKKTFYSCVSLAVLLSGCGGSGSSVTEDVRLPVLPDDTMANHKVYGDSNVVSISPDLGGDKGASNLFMSSDGGTASVEVATGDIVFSTVQGSEVVTGDFYFLERTGTGSGGGSIAVRTSGEKLNATNDYVELSSGTIADKDALFTSGSQIVTLPSGNFTYTGAAAVREVGAGANTGSFTMTANFTDNSATLMATIPADQNTAAYFFTANDITINPTTGSFGDISGNATIGQTGSTSMKASVVGSFAGSNAEGVHGLVYDDAQGQMENSATYIGAFAGSR